MSKWAKIWAICQSFTVHMLFLYFLEKVLFVRVMKTQKPNSHEHKMSLIWTESWAKQQMSRKSKWVTKFQLFVTHSLFFLRFYKKVLFCQSYENTKAKLILVANEQEVKVGQKISAIVWAGAAVEFFSNFPFQRSGKGRTSGKMYLFLARRLNLDSWWTRLANS